MKESWGALALLLCFCAAAPAGTETNVLSDPSLVSWPDSSTVDDTSHLANTFNTKAVPAPSSPSAEVKQDDTSVAIPPPPALYTGLATLSLLGGWLLRRRILH